MGIRGRADTWWRRHHAKVLGLQFVENSRRPDRDNASDVYLSDEYEDVLAEGIWQKTFAVRPDPLTAEEKKAWVAALTLALIHISYKNDELGDPLLNSYHALALKLATAEEIETIKKYAFAVNDILKAFWAECGVTLVDFKLEFGRLTGGTIVLADEISPDTCRLWDEKTHEKLDKDRFRRDLGGVEGAYAEVMQRLLAHDAD